MKKDTKKALWLTGIVASIVGAIAAISSNAKAQTAPPPPTPNPDPGNPPQPPGSSQPPTQPPQQPPPSPTPPASTPAPAQNAPVADTSTFPTPGSGTVAALARLSKWDGSQWVVTQDVALDYASAIPLDLSTLFNKLTAYSAVKQPPYQNVQVFVWSTFGAGNGWNPTPVANFYNYDTGKSTGMLMWTWVRVWEWSGTWTVKSESGPQSSAVPVQSLANAIKQLPAPPYFFTQVFGYDPATQKWSYVAHATNY